jgi:hypothetical protein
MSRFYTHPSAPQDQHASRMLSKSELRHCQIPVASQPHPHRIPSNINIGMRMTLTQILM